MTTTSANDTQIDQEWTKFMMKISKQNDCDIGDDDEVDEEDDIQPDNFDISNRTFAPPIAYTLNSNGSNITSSSISLHTASSPTAVSTNKGVSKPPKRTCISKKQQRKTYSFVDTLEETNSLYSTESNSVNLLGPDIITENAKQSYADMNNYEAAHDMQEVAQVSALCGEEKMDVSDVVSAPKSSAIYISTKTKIAYVNKKVDIYRAFWDVPVIHYYTRKEGVIKKQIKFQTTNPADVAEINEKLIKQPRYYDQQIIEHIDNPEGRIVFKDQRKVSVGICKKDLLNNNSKKKRAFFNCFVLILRINGGICTDETVKSPNDNILFKEMHVKVFNTGKLEIPGIQDDRTLIQVLDLLVSILRPVLGEDLNYLKDRCETVLINSNFNCGYYINRDKLFHLMKYKYRINSNYDSCSYPGIQCKFYYIPGETTQTGQQPLHLHEQKYYEISFMIFRTGSILIVGKCNESILMYIYQFIKHILEDEFHIIQMGLVARDNIIVTNVKLNPMTNGGDGDDGDGDGGGDGGGDGSNGNEIEFVEQTTRKPKITAKTRRKIIMVGNISPFIPLVE
jgi:hypothetical protein